MGDSRPSNISGFLCSLAANIVVAVLACLRERFSTYFERHIGWTWVRHTLWVFAVLYCLILGGHVGWLLYHRQFVSLSLGPYVIPPLVGVYFWFRMTQRSTSVGVIAIDAEIRKGTDYKKALRLCRTELQFLGTGAAKLTGQQEAFEEALSRCRQDKPIRFLLMKSDAPILEEAAKRAQRDSSEFRRIVRESLRKIAEVKEKRSLNKLEVKFYKEEQQPFRLMFINDSICLLSYNVFGRGDGSQLPQIHIARARAGKHVESTLYYPLLEYYNRLWEKAKRWDFKEYLND